MIGVGGALGATARFELAAAFPHAPHEFPWATFATNVSGCFLIGVLMVLVTDVWSGHRLLRPFLGVGVLGGFTTFSTYVVETQQALTAGAPRLALFYLAGTLVAALVAVFAGQAATRWLVKALSHKDIP
ncbi:fluoride efflux transporter FluC [Flindersiella endophytica]